MRIPKFASPTGKIAYGASAILLLFVGAVWVTAWRYQAALARSDNALATRSEQFRSQQAATAFWQEREAVNEFVFDHDPGLPGEVSSAHARFTAATTGLGTDAAEQSLVERVRAANDSLTSVIARYRITPGSRGGIALIARLNVLEPSVTGPMTRLQNLYTAHVAADDSAVRSAKREALIAALLAGLLAIAGGIGFAVYALRLVGRISQREGALQATVEELAERELSLQKAVASLSDRDELLEQVRRSRPGELPAHSAQLTDEDEVLASGEQPVERGVLGGHADVPADLGGVTDDVDPRHRRPAAVGQRKRRQHAHRCRLAGAVGAEQPEQRSRLDREVHPGEGLGFAVPLGQRLDFDHDLAHEPTSPVSLTTTSRTRRTVSGSHRPTIKMRRPHLIWSQGSTPR